MRSDQLTMSTTLLALAILTSSMGCGSSNPSHVQVMGKVTLDGKPVPEAQVYLSSNAPGTAGKIVRTHSAIVVDGAFQFPARNGPPPGDYEVIVRPVEPDTDAVWEQMKSKDRSLLKDREGLIEAVKRKGPVNVKLETRNVNVVSIELSSR